MSDISTKHQPQKAETRRDFLYYATGGVAIVTTGAAVWPLINSMNPSADVSALSVVTIDLEGVEPGSRITLKWSGKPIFIDRRSEERIAQAQADDVAQMPDPEPDAERVQNSEWLVVVGVCTHLGCIPLGQGDTESTGDWQGWFCPCHGSHYDTSGRIRKGPAPRNLDVPPYQFVSDKLIEIG